MYTGPNAEFTPAHMDFDKGKFDYGSWEDSWLLKKFRPCMLNHDGTVAYYLNPDDVAYKEDGTKSEFAYGSYDTCAGQENKPDKEVMIEIGQIWIKEEEEEGGDKIHIWLSPDPQDGFDCLSHTNAKGNIVDYIYHAKYPGRIDPETNKLRSLASYSNILHSWKESASTFAETRATAQAHGAGWDIEEWSFYRLLWYCTLLIGKSVDVQTTFGYGAELGDGYAIDCTSNVTPPFYGVADEDFEWSTISNISIFGILGVWSRSYGVLGAYYDAETNEYLIKMTPEYSVVDYNKLDTLLSDYIRVGSFGLDEGACYTSRFITTIPYTGWSMKLKKGYGIFPHVRSNTTAEGDIRCKTWLTFDAGYDGLNFYSGNSGIFTIGKACYGQYNGLFAITPELSSAVYLCYKSPD